MTQDHRAPHDVAAFAAMVEAYGANPERWPAGAHSRFAPLIEHAPEAGRILSEAKALDRVLAAAPLVPVARRQVAAGRVVEAAGIAVDADPSGNVVRLPLGRRQRGLPPLAPSRTGLQAAALMAASLAMGVFLGASGLMTATGSGLASLAGIDAEPDVFAVALNQAVGEPIDEDLQ